MIKRFNLHRRLAAKRWCQVGRLAILAVLACLLGSLLLQTTLVARSNAEKPIDAVLVLGGSISREIYVAKLAKQYPNLPILISHGSDDPCIFSIFRQEGARLNNVWLEKCADSTFGNFFFSAPILRHWGAHKVMMITSASHLPRAQWLAQILLGAQGIWVETEIVQERGRPGNEESQLKTALDVTRSLLWAPLSQIVRPPCSKINQLSEIDWETWEREGYACERQVQGKPRNNSGRLKIKTRG